MVLGQAPPPRLVQKYGFSDHFSNEMLLAWKRGNFAGFQACVDDDRVWWLRKGCFNIIRERTKVIMFQNLFRSVYVVSCRSLNLERRIIRPTFNRFLIIRSQTSSQAISLNSCHVACHAAGLTDFTLADVENTVANLIELVSPAPRIAPCRLGQPH